MNLKAFSVVSDVDHPGAERLRRSAAYWGWEHTFIKQETNWRPTYKAEQIGQLEALRRFSPEFFLYVDGWDTVFTGPPQELPLKKGKLWFGGDTVVYPSGLAEENFPAVGLEQFRFVNCGAIWGDSLILQELAAEYLTHSPEVINQEYFNHRYVFERGVDRYRLEIDTRGEVALNIMLVQLRHFKFKHNRIFYSPTNTMPLILHSAGVGPSLSEQGKLAPMPAELEKLYG